MSRRAMSRRAMSRRAVPRPLDTRLDQEEVRRTAGATERGAAAIRRGHIWRATAAMDTFIRSALARAGIDAAQATRLSLADEAAAALIALSDRPELERADGSPAGGEAQGRAPADDFGPKILALAPGFADGPPPDFAKASFAELYAWSLASSRRAQLAMDVVSICRNRI
jgi:hypothetical protein